MEDEKARGGGLTFIEQVRVIESYDTYALIGFISNSRMSGSHDRYTAQISDQRYRVLEIL